MQLQNHRTTVSSLVLLLGVMDRAKDHLKTLLYTAYIDSNDYLNNYYLPQFYSSSRLDTPLQFAHILKKHAVVAKKFEFQSMILIDFLIM